KELLKVVAFMPSKEKLKGKVIARAVCEKVVPLGAHLRSRPDLTIRAPRIDDNVRTTADPLNSHDDEHDCSPSNGDILALAGQRRPPPASIGENKRSRRQHHRSRIFRSNPTEVDLDEPDDSDALNDIFSDPHPTVDSPTAIGTTIDGRAAGGRQRGTGIRRRPRPRRLQSAVVVKRWRRMTVVGGR
ncbi:hypothetical protein ACLOJK_019216, partial [Asimina triloba]